MFRVAILGRPNVGKSTLFNRLCQMRRAIVGDEPGVTRDRIVGMAAWAGQRFQLIDTGGMLPGVQECIPAMILDQVGKAIEEADLLMLVVDGRAGLTSLDEQLLPVVRRTGKPFWVLVNKIDTVELESAAGPFYRIGGEQLFTISSEHGNGIGELLDALAERAETFAEAEGSEEASEVAVAVVGRPNVGKSSLVNRLLGFERTIVTDIPGTTRDAVDSLVVHESTRYRIIDTAGIRRKGKTEERTEKVSVIVARKNLERADVAILVLDSEEGVTKLDAAIGGYASETGCSVIIALNKWDKVEKDEHTIEQFTDDVYRRMKYLGYAPVITISALTGQRVSKLFEMIDRAYESRKIRIPTGTLNNMFVPDLADRFQARNPSHRLEIRYITQTRSDPPTFVVFTGGRERLHFSTERFLVNQLRERFGFYATPIRIRQRTRERQERGRGARSKD